MPFLDVPERPCCNDDLPRGFIDKAGPALCLYNAIAEDNRTRQPIGTRSESKPASCYTHRRYRPRNSLIA